MWAVGLRVLNAGYAEAPLYPQAWTPASALRAEAYLPSLPISFAPFYQLHRNCTKQQLHLVPTA